MLKAVRCDRDTFREVRFKPGFNVILADRIREATDKDSRNGVGKTTLIEIIHFCLGASTRKNEGLRVKQLEDWTFILDFSLKGNSYSVYRNTMDYSKIKLEGDVSSWPFKPAYDEIEKKYILPVKDWNVLLGQLDFGIPADAADKKYTPTFRSLISYFMRRGVGAFQVPFRHYPQQKEWDMQVNNAFLLGLNWEQAARFQELKDKEKTLGELKKALNQGLLTGYVGSMGELKAELVRLEEKISRVDNELNSFKVHPQYIEIQEEVNRITREIHDITNRSTINRQILDKYRESVVQERDVSINKMKQVYREAGLVFPGSLEKKLDEVSDFHKQLIANRKDYLEAETGRLAREIKDQEIRVEQLSNRRAERMVILQTHGALDEYTKLQERAAGFKQQLEEVKNRLENLRQFDEGKSRLKIAGEELYQETRRDYDERFPHIEKAIKLFNGFSEKLYSEPGILSLDVTGRGYKMDVDIKRAGSQGIGYMKIFCYDLTLARLFSQLRAAPIFLIHDSTIYDGVDERQIAKALELAAVEAESQGIQYICALNSDNVPDRDFSETFQSEFDKHVIVTFTDAADDGGLLGIRF
ncbi:MAG: DUF2326 domain-containing protein [Candidatus Aminicenantes bacterium]|nr:DUF2326 domain-containing protein [Candidatus Aminicenantes bacterium]